jgi:DNA-binding transcriptional MerR regulator
VASTTYSIKDLEQLTGIKAHTLRIWEKRYKIVEPRRTPTNIRFYTDEDLRKLLNISILNRQGFKISNIANLENEALNKTIISINTKSLDNESHIEGMMLAMLELDEQKFDKLLNSLILNLGFEDTMTKVLSPFFEKIGILWQIGTINPAQEHFISNLIRQKMIVAIDGLIKPTNIPNQKTFILYLHETELHELTLLFYSYLIQRKGHKVIYLGQMVPIDDLSLIADIQNPDVIVSVFTSTYKINDIQDHLDKLALLFTSKKIFAGGLQFKLHQYNLPSNVILIESIDSLKHQLDLLT